jgi:hypothetical protein
VDEVPNLRQGLGAPATQRLDPLVDETGGRLPGRARFASAPGLAFAPAFVGDLVLDLRGLLARDVPLAFGSLLFGFGATIHSPTLLSCPTSDSGIFGYHARPGVIRTSMAERRGSLAFIPSTICPEANSKVKCENESLGDRGDPL